MFLKIHYVTQNNASNYNGEVRVKLLTPSQVADLVQVDRRTVYMWVSEGKLKGYKFGSRVRIKESDLAAFMKPRKTS